MTKRRLFTAATAVAASALLWTAALRAQTVQRAMYVSALNEAGAPVADLGPADFIIREDNAAREVLKAEPATEPMQIAVVVDTSQAARNDIPHIRTALPPFVKALIEADAKDVKNEVSIVAIGERPTVFTNYTSNLKDLQKGIDRIWSVQGSGTYLLDGIIEIGQGFKKRGAQRPVIVAIVSEGPELANRHHEEVLRSLQTTGAALYVFSLGRPNTSLRDEMRERAFVLDEGPRNSGGKHEDLLTPMALAAKLTQLADVLTHQYKVTYARTTTLIPAEKVTVASAKPGITARGTLIQEAKARP
jgi:hypothetical protein